MNRLSRMLLVLAAAFVTLPGAAQTQKRAMTFSDLMSMQRIGEPAISPDGRWVAYTVAAPDLATNKTARNI